MSARHFRSQRPQTRERTSPVSPPHVPLGQLSPEELQAWLEGTQEQLLRKMHCERTYLDRRAARGIHTSTDEAYEADQVLEAELLALLDEIEQALLTGG